MAKMRKYLIGFAPHFIWMLAFSLGYSMLSCLFLSLVDSGDDLAMLAYYYRGLLLLVPLVIFSVSVKRSAHIWQFLLVSVLTLGAVHLLLQDWFFTVLALLVCALRAGNRIRQQLQILDEELPQESVLDHPSKFLLAMPALYYLVAGNAGLALFQEMALYHFVGMCIAFFVLEGLVRFEEYVQLAQMNATVPSKRILETGTRIFVGAALVLAITLLPVLRTQYEFVPITFDFSSDAEWEYEEEDVAEESTDYSAEMFADIEESDPVLDLSWLWEILDKLLLVGFYFIVVYGLYRLFKMIIVNFNKTQVEKNDVIESTFQEDSAQLQFQRQKQRFAELFGLSEAMRIRRRYKRQCKQAKPKSWQTPSEIEAMAGKDMPELHVLYEDVRYGKKDAP